MVKRTVSSRKDIEWAIESTRGVPIPDVLDEPQYENQRAILRHATVRVVRDMEKGEYGEHGVALADSFFDSKGLFDGIGSISTGLFSGIGKSLKTEPFIRPPEMDRILPLLRDPQIEVGQRQLSALESIHSVLDSLLERQMGQEEQAERDRKTGTRRHYVTLAIVIALGLAGLVVSILGVFS